MLRNLISRRPAGLVLAAAALGWALLLGGCGNNQSSSSLPVPSSTGSAPKVAATGPAISTPLAFEQVPLESPVKKAKNKNGLVFLSFSYADSDGKIYKCELPEAMSNGSYSPEEWIRTFNIYKRPEVIGHKPKKKGGPTVIGDFPFVSPRPQTVEQPQQPGAPAPQPIQMPTPLPMPSQPQVQPMRQPMPPRGVPSNNGYPKGD